MKKLSLCVLWLAACSSQKEAVSLQTSQTITAADYEEVLGRWTRNDNVYDKLYSVVFVYATFHSPEFRTAFLYRHQDIYGRGSEEARRLSLTNEGAEEFLEFFMSAWTPDTKWNDFAEEDSIWRVTLESLEKDAEPVDGKVEKIKTTANIRVIYPYVSDFARTYAVRFPRTTRSGTPVITSQSPGFLLRVRSGLGQAELTWLLQPVSTSSVAQ